MFAAFLLETASAQKIYVNTSNAVYQLNCVNGNCQLDKIPTLCNLTQSRTIYSIAIFNDTLYYNSGKLLFRVIPNKPASCELVAAFPGSGVTFNCMAADKYGFIYTIEYNSRILYRFDPNLKKLDTLGILPVAPAGDLMFYKGRLLYASQSDGIYEVNMNDPANSKQFMSTPGYSFYGLLSFPYNCNANAVYGISLNASVNSTDLVELDLDKKTILSKFTTLPYGLYDAASSVDNGNTLGLTLDSVEVKTERCSPSSGTDMRFLAFTAVDGPINYLLDGIKANKDGKFSKLSPGRHELRMENSKGCSFDTTFTVAPILDPKPAISIVKEDQSCYQNSGRVTINITGADQPYLINFQREGFKTLNSYDRLAVGQYSISVRNKDGCTWDTVTNIVSTCDTLFMPTAFTPNGDGKNDYLRPIYGTAITDVSFHVFSRLGEKIYEFTGTGKGWDGSINSHLQPTGSYAFVVKYKNGSGRQMFRKGTVTLIR